MNDQSQVPRRSPRLAAAAAAAAVETARNDLRQEQKERQASRRSPRLATAAAAANVGNDHRQEEERQRATSANGETVARRGRKREAPAPAETVSTSKSVELSNEDIPRGTISIMLKILPPEDLAKIITIPMSDEEKLYNIARLQHMEESGLPNNIIRKRLRTKTYAVLTVLSDSEASSNTELCSICMADYKSKDKIAMLYYCPHEFHADCIKKWLSRRNLCPMCRTLALIPEGYPDWKGDIDWHRTSFQRMFRLTLQQLSDLRAKHGIA